MAEKRSQHYRASMWRDKYPKGGHGSPEHHASENCRLCAADTLAAAVRAAFELPNVPGGRARIQRALERYETLTK